MKIPDEAYACIINVKTTNKIKLLWYRLNFKLRGYQKNDPKFIKKYGLDDIPEGECETWSKGM